MDRELRDWLRGLAEPPARASVSEHDDFSAKGAEYLARVATDGTLKRAFAEMAAGDPELDG